MQKNRDRGSCSPLSLHRRLSHWLFALLGLYVLIGSAAAATQSTAGDGEVLRATLDNGLRVVIVRNTLAPVVTTEVNYLAGSNEVPKGFPGTAHALEHMMFRGSPGLSSAQLADVSAALGGNFDADTQQTVTQYFFTVPSNDLEVALHIQATRMRGLLADEKAWEKERGAIEQEVAQDLSSPQYVMYKRLLAEAFKGTPYAHDALGTRPSFDQTTAAMLKKFYAQWYAPNNAIMVVVGDVEPKQALGRIEALFGGIPAKKTPKRPAIHLQPVKAQTLHMKTDRPYGLAVVTLRMPGYRSPDYAAAQVLADALASERGALYELGVQGKALSTDFSLMPLPDAGLAMATVAFPAGGDPGKLIDQVRGILTDAAKHGMPADLVEAAKRDEVTSAELQKNSISGLAMAWSDALAVQGLHSPQEGIEAIQKVTPKDVQRVARRYLDLDHAMVAILTPQRSGKPVAAKGFGGKESFTPEHTAAVKLPEWAQRAVERVELPRSTLHPVTTMLPNGIKLIVQPASVSHTVTLYGHIENEPDLQVPEGQEGVDQVLGQLFDFGTTRLDRVAFQKALDDIGADASAGIEFQARALTPHFERAVQLLADNELHPALPEKAFTTVRRQVADTVAGRLHSPGYLTRQALRAGLFPKDDPSLRQATPKSVNALTLKDVRGYYEQAFRPDLTTIVVVGDITSKRARQVVESAFGDWKASGEKPATTLPPVPLNRPTSTFVPNASRVQSEVLLAETLGLDRFNPDYYALQLGNHVLGGGFYATRLYHDLREKGGLVYHVDSAFMVGKTRGVYLVNYACDPPNVGKARTIVERDLRQMQQMSVDEDGFRRAQALALREIPLNESSVGAIAQGFIHRAHLGLPLDEPQRAARHYATLTPKQVKAAYAKWLRVDDLVQVTQGPPGK